MLDGGVDITILPPTNANDDVTDEDSGEEESPVADNLPASQLLAPDTLNIHCPSDDFLLEKESEPVASTSAGN